MLQSSWWVPVEFIVSSTFKFNITFIRNLFKIWGLSQISVNEGILPSLSPSSCNHVILCHLLADPSPWSACFIYEQPCTKKNVLRKKSLAKTKNSTLYHTFTKSVQTISTSRQIQFAQIRIAVRLGFVYD